MIIRMEAEEIKARISLSVIIPVYNTARWVGECLDSILAQDAFDLEVICVDDGSTDESPVILREYAEKDSRVKVITQQNQGPAAARNTGIEAARSEYLWFFDSDDTVNSETVNAIYQAVKNYGKPEVVCFPAVHWIVDQNYLGPRRKKESAKSFVSALNGIHTGPEALQILLSRKRYWLWICMHLFRKDFLFAKGLRFLESLRRHEDVEFMIRVYRDAVSVLGIPEMVANRRIREGSSIDIVSKNITTEDMKVKFRYFTEISKIYSESEDLKQNTPAFRAFLMARVQRCQEYYKRYLQNNPDEKGRLTFLPDHDKEILFDLSIRYPVETGRNLIALKEAEKKLSSRKYRIYSMLPAPVGKMIRAVLKR